MTDEPGHVAGGGETLDDLTPLLLQISGLLVPEESVQSALDRICELAHQAIAGTTGAAVSLMRGNRRTAAYSNPDPVMRADELQYEMDEGPCVSAWRDKKVYRIDSMADEKRWPRWTAAAGAMGVQSCVSAPVMVRDQAIGAIKAYSDMPSHYTDRDERTLSLLASQAAVVLMNVVEYSEATSTINQLKEAIGTRDVIGMAKGILMEREGVTDERAFDMLRVASQTENIKLRDIAAKIVERAAGRDSG